MTHELIGSCPVDSGQLILIDPCYLLDGKMNEDLYNRIVETTCNDPWGGSIIVDGFASGTAVSTGWGDGNYPVWVTKNNHDRIVKVTIDFE